MKSSAQKSLLGNIGAMSAGLVIVCSALLALPSVSHAQTQTEANAFARLVSVLLTTDKSQLPPVTFGESKTFTYGTASCTRTMSDMSRGGTASDTLVCGQGTGATRLTATCADTTGLRNTCRVTNASGATVQINGEDTFSPNRVGEDTQINDAGQQVGENTGQPASEANSCGLDFLCALGKLPGMILSAIALFLLMLAGGILALVGTVFNWIVIRTVFQFGTYFGTSEGMLIAWGVMRDVANIALLFGFIFMGVLLILNVESGGHGHGGGLSARKAIPRLIIFAVLLNFSLFASQVVIDVSNAFSAQFATLAGAGCAEGTTGDSGATSDEDCANVGISGKVMEATGMSAIFTTELLTANGAAAAGGSIASGFTAMTAQPYSYSVMLICLALFTVITALVLLAGAIMLVIRVVVLSLLMVTSPIGVAGLAIPKLQGIANEWWSKLLSQSFFAPIYLLLIFISLKLAEGLMDGEATIAAALMGNQGSAAAGNLQVVMVFMIVIGFMIGSLMAASKMGAMGASFASSFATKAVGYPFAWIGRNTVGAGSAKALKSYESSLGKARNSNNILVRGFAKGVIATGADDAVTGALSQGKDMKFLGMKSYDEMSKHRAERESHIKHEGDKAEATATLKSALASGNIGSIEQALQKMGDSDIRDYIKSSKGSLDTIAQNLSPEKFANLMKDKDLPSDKKHALSHGRFHELEGYPEAIAEAGRTNGPAAQEAEFNAVKSAIKLWSNDDLTEFAKANPATFQQLIELDNENGESLFTDDQREALEKSKGLTNSQRLLVKDNSIVKRIDRHVASGDPTRIAKAQLMMGKISKAKDRAKLDSASLLNDAIIDTLTANDLKEIMSEAKLEPADRTTIMNRINNTNHPNNVSINAYLNNNRTDQLVKDYWR